MKGLKKMNAKVIYHPTSSDPIKRLSELM